MEKTKEDYYCYKDQFQKERGYEWKPNNMTEREYIEWLEQKLLSQQVTPMENSFQTFIKKDRSEFSGIRDGELWTSQIPVEILTHNCTLDEIRAAFKGLAPIDIIETLIEENDLVTMVLASSVSKPDIRNELIMFAKYVHTKHIERRSKSWEDEVDDYLSSHNPDESDGWISVKDRLPDYGIPVNGYHHKWVDKDFNPNGIDECQLYGDKNW